jgi:hypothetical protein
VALFYSLIPVHSDYELKPLDLKRSARSRSISTPSVKSSVLERLIKIWRSRFKGGGAAHLA